MKTTLRGLALAAVLAAAAFSLAPVSGVRPRVFRSPGGLQESHPTGGVTVRGRVDHDGTPVVGARVRLISSTPSGGSILVTTPPLLQAETSEDGRFELAHVPAGPARLAVIADGLAPSISTCDVTSGLDLAIRLDKGMTLEGRVSIGAGARVSVRLAGRDALFDRRPLREAITDAEGRYRIEGLDPARPVRLAVFADRCRPFEKTYRLPSLAPALIDLEPGLAAWGQVVTASGAPVAGAEVTAGQGEAYSAEARSGIAGEVRLGGLIARPVSIRVFKEGYAPAKLFLSEPSPGWTVVLRRNGGIAGTAPGGTWLVVETPAASFRRAVDSDGSFRWEGLPAGPAEARVTDNTGRVLAARKVEIPEGDVAGGILLAP